MRWLTFIVFLTCAASGARADLKEAEEAAKKFELPAGFKIQAVAAEPQLFNPVAFSMDERGRIYVAETHRLDNSVVDITKNTNWIKNDLSFRHVHERARFLTNAFGTNAMILTNRADVLRVLDDADGDGIWEKSTAPRGFRQVASGIAAGVLARGNRVWFACIPDLWRFDNLMESSERVRILSSGYGVHIGVTGHDLHGLAIGMDGKLYFSVGDRGFNVKTPGGQIAYPDTGAVLRCNQDGGELEVVAIGLRNPQELAFDELGNLWTADNDTAGEDKCRLIHVVEGADYGWRASYQHMPGFGPWVQEKLWEGRLDGVLPNAGEPGHGPSGLAYNPGTGLPREFDGHFLMCDFPGGIQSFSVEPKGASYVMKDRKKFLWNTWPTDVEFGTDGALYFSDWVGGWTLPNKGRIYRLTHPDVKGEQTAAILRGGFEDKDSAALVALLEYHDLRVRQNAHLALGRKRDAADSLRALATNQSKSRLARLHAIWALRLQGPFAGEALEKLLADKDAEIRAQASLSANMPQLIKLLKDESPRVRFHASMGIARRLILDTGSSTVTEAIVEMLEANVDADPFLTHAGVRMLTLSQPALARARKHTALAVRRAALIAERTMALPSVANYLAEPSLAYEAARAINDVPIPKAYLELASRLTNTCPPEMLSRAINVNYRLGGPNAAKRLAMLASATNVQAAMRVEALHCLAEWQEPDELDRVVGLWRPVSPNVQTRAESLAVAALEPQLPGLLSDHEPAVVGAALRCVRELVLENQSTNVLAILKAADRPADLRSAALESLRELNAKMFGSALENAIGDQALRVGAMKLIGTNAPPAVAGKLVQIITNEKDKSTLQAALGAIGRIAPAEAVDVLKKLLGEKSLDIYLDVIEASRPFPSLKNEVDSANFDEAILAGGDVIEGRNVFNNRSDVACTRCHQVKGAGGTVGPALDGIGARQTRAYLLESILFPNKAIAKGYDNVLVTLKGGRNVAGIVTEETTVSMTIESPEDGTVVVKKSDVAKAQQTLSAMPEGLGQMMTAFELRNLVEYLASLK